MSTFDESDARRRPRGVTGAGQFTQAPRAEAEVTLVTGIGETATVPAAPDQARRVVTLPKRGIPLTPEQERQRASRIHRVDESDIDPARRQAIRERSDWSSWTR